MFLLIDNYSAFTCSLVHAFIQQGRTPLVVAGDDPGLPDMACRSDLEMVCISPGPGRPEHATHCLEFLRRLPPSVPVLGLGLGHLILGHAAKARIRTAFLPMHGEASLVSHNGQGLFQGLPNPMSAGRYDILLLDEASFPETLEVTARSTGGISGAAVCQPYSTSSGNFSLPSSTATTSTEPFSSGNTPTAIMGIRYIDRPWAGIQFHPESVLTPEGERLLANFPTGIMHNDLSADASPAASYRNGTTPIHMASVMEQLALGHNLTPETAAGAFSRLMDGELSPSVAGAFLLGLRAKGETPEEMGEAVHAVLARAVPIPPVTGECIDIVGTGGDNKSSFNCSTATALTLAGLGYKVLKHGNRSVSSRCGSADVLERLGIPLDTPPESVARTLEKERFVFLFAPRYHPSFKHVMPIRRELGVRTLFNLLGPLVNPAKPTHHFLGVPKKEFLPLLAHSLARTSSGTGAVVCGAGGYDELTPLGEAEILFVENGSVRPARLNPEEYGFSLCKEEDLAVSGPEEAEEVLRALLSGNGPKAMADMLALNTGFALYLLESGKTDDPDSFPNAPLNSSQEKNLESDSQNNSGYGFDRRRMENAMKTAQNAIAQGAGRRFCHA